MMGTTTLAFHGQDYPADRRELIILDDAGELQNDSCGGWQIISIPRRFRSLPEKFNAIAGLAKGDILVVWEDDDIYLPHHISTHVRAMEGRLWSKPSFVLSSYTGRLEQEDATGRFHAPSHRRYTGSRVFFAPWREDVFVTQRRKDAKVNRHRTARAVPLTCGLKIRPSRPLARVIRRSSLVNAMASMEFQNTRKTLPGLVWTAKRQVGGPIFIFAMQRLLR